MSSNEYRHLIVGWCWFPEAAVIKSECVDVGAGKRENFDCPEVQLLNMDQVQFGELRSEVLQSRVELVRVEIPSPDIQFLSRVSPQSRLD